MKNRLFLVLSAVAILAVSSFVSCTKDLQNDLSNLDSKVTTLQGTVDDLNKQIAAGAVITNVEKNGGVVKVTLSNGKTFEVKDGKDGKDGKDADVWTIVDGYWAKNGEITEYQAVADQWVPGEDGYWYCNGEKTDISWKASSLTAVYEDGILTLYNVDGTEEPVVIGGNLFGLTIVPSVIKEGLPVTFFYELVVGDDEPTHNPNLKSTNKPVVDADNFVGIVKLRMDPPTMAALTCDYNVIIRNVAVMHTDARTRAEGDMVGLVVAYPEYRDDDAVVLRITPNATATEEELEAIYTELYQSYVAVGGAINELEKAIRKHKINPDDMKVENQALVLTFQAVMGDQVITSDYSYVAMAPIYEKDIHMMYDNPYDEEPAEEVTKKHQHPKTFVGKFAWNETLDVVEFINVTHDYEGFVKFEDLYDVEYACEFTDREENKMFVLDGSELSVAEEVGMDAIGEYAYVKVNATVGEDIVATGIVKALVVPILRDEYVWNVDLGDVYYFDLTDEFEVVPADPEEAATPKNFVKEWIELGLTAEEFMGIYGSSAKFEFPDGTKYEPNGDTINVAMNYEVAFGEGMAKAILYPNEKPSIYPDSIVVNFFFNVTGIEDFEFPPLAPAYKIDENTVKLQGVSAKGAWYYGVNQIEHFDTIGYVVPEAVKMKFAQVEGNAYNWPSWWTKEAPEVYSWMEGVDEETEDGAGPFDNETESRVQEARLLACFANGDTLWYDYDVVMVNPFEASIDADEAILYVHGVNQDSLYLDEALYIEDFQGIPLYMNGEVVTPNPYYFTQCWNDDPESLVPGIHDNEIIVAWDYKNYDIKTIDGEHFDNANGSFEVKKVTVYDEAGESHTKLVAIWNNKGAGLQKPLIAKFKGTVYIYDADNYIIGKYDVELPITIKTAYED